MVSALDEAVGDIKAKLEEREMFGDTLIIFTTDVRHMYTILTSFLLLVKLHSSYTLYKVIYL